MLLMQDQMPTLPLVAIHYLTAVSACYTKCSFSGS